MYVDSVEIFPERIIMTEYENIQPSPIALVESLRDIGYSMETAVADILDNSITADAGSIHIRFAWNEGDPWIAFIDNGCGMTDKELTDAMRLGSKNPLIERSENDLGRFGLGLKTASFSQCRKLTVITRKQQMLSAKEWDLDAITENPDKGWRLRVLTNDDVSEINELREVIDKFMSSSNGTIILWRKLDRLDNFDVPAIREKKLNELVNATRNHIELIFHRYLSPSKGKKKLNITLNGDSLYGFNPFNPSNNATRELPEQKIHLEDEQITVQPYVLPHYNKVSREEYERYAGEAGYLQNQGFYVYRNRRLIIKNTWFRLIAKEELTKLIRVRIDIPNTLDHLWKIDVKKSNASPPEFIRKQLKQIIFEIQESGKRVFRQKGQRLSSKVTTPIWNRRASSGKIIYEINQVHPLVGQIQDSIHGEDKYKFKILIKTLESSFPADVFFNDVANHPEKLEKPAFNDDQLSELLDIFVSNFIESGIDNEKIPVQILSIDPFASQEELTKNILVRKGYLYE